eukprot:c18743_g1_i1.p1 GENE.c18743_g1_i1~~c18743_g1_i1.p1  ORF type:complete len:387 (+),score=141.69 c18743_g1_i1:23-1183(+)
MKKFWVALFFVYLTISSEALKIGANEIEIVNSNKQKNLLLPSIKRLQEKIRDISSYLKSNHTTQMEPKKAIDLFLEQTNKLLSLETTTTTSGSQPSSDLYISDMIFFSVLLLIGLLSSSAFIGAFRNLFPNSTRSNSAVKPKAKPSVETNENEIESVQVGKNNEVKPKSLGNKFCGSNDVDKHLPASETNVFPISPKLVDEQKIVIAKKIYAQDDRKVWDNGSKEPKHLIYSDYNKAPEGRGFKHLSVVPFQFAKEKKESVLENNPETGEPKRVFNRAPPAPKILNELCDEHKQEILNGDKENQVIKCADNEFCHPEAKCQKKDCPQKLQLSSDSLKIKGTNKSIEKERDAYLKKQATENQKQDTETVLQRNIQNAKDLMTKRLYI